MTAQKNDFDISHLNRKQKKIAKAVIAATKEAWSPGREPSGGGCQAFYTPEEWKARGEQYGTESELILCHDGGDLYYMCNWDSDLNWTCNYRGIETLRKHLEPMGYFIEQCTSWYSAVYKA